MIIHNSNITNVFMPLGKSVYTDFKIVYSIFLNCVLLPPKRLVSLNILWFEPVVTLLFPDSHEHLDPSPWFKAPWGQNNWAYFLGLVSDHLVCLYINSSFIPCYVPGFYLTLSLVYNNFFKWCVQWRYFHDLPLNKWGWLIFWWIINKSI